MTTIMKKLPAWAGEGYITKVDMHGNIDEYARNFLVIFNTVKSSAGFIKVWNDYKNGVEVTYTDELEPSDVEEWLSQFGDIMWTRKAKTWTVNYMDLPDIPEGYEEVVLWTDC